MLSAAPKGEAAGAILLRPEEDAALRQAFGRWGGSAAAREAAAPIVARYQQMAGGRWFLCDCRPDAERPPVLVPVAESHIRRHEDRAWPAHTEACPFYREPAEERIVSDSYRPEDRPLRLARAWSAAAAAPAVEIVSSRKVDRRPGIARLLMQLITKSGLQAIAPAGSWPILAEQVAALWQAAKGIQLDSEARLPDFLCTSAGRYPELVDRIATARADRFTRNRPHGVMIIRVGAVERGQLRALTGETFAVRGRLAVFGESAGEDRDSAAGRAARAPYLAACVVGRALPGAPIEVLTAYAHPIASDRQLLLVDSALERQTLAQILSAQRWLRTKLSVQLTIEKPLFDLGPALGSDDPPRPPLIPDFLVRANGIGPSGSGLVIVETMGFADDEYRARKRRIHAAMRQLFADAPVVFHDFHEPVGQDQAQRDRNFWRDLRWAITGPGEKS